MIETLFSYRTYRQFAGLAGILALLLTGSMVGAQTAEQGKPNIIIILADDMGYGDVSMNNPQARTATPHIDDLGANGITFTDAHSGGAVCIPSRYGLITGRYFFRAPQQEGSWGYLTPLIEHGRETIASLMQKAGYTTACIGKWHLGLDWHRKDDSKPQVGELKTNPYTNTDFTRPIGGGPSALGFDYSFILPGSLDMPPYVFVRDDKTVDPDIILATDVYPKNQKGTVEAWDRKHTNENDIYWGHGVWWRNGEMSRTFRIEKCLGAIVDEGIAFMQEQERNNSGKPFMLYLPLTGPHTPWVPDDGFKGSSAMGTYGDFVSQIDHAVYRITETLKALDLEENTLVIFSSDNGAPWQEEDIQTYGHRSNVRRGQKGDAWDGGHHIPLFVKWPAAIKAPRTYPHTVSLVDLMATFAELSGQTIGVGNAEDSYSFYSALSEGYREPVRDHVVYISSSGQLAVKKGDWKLIDCLGSGGFTPPSRLKPVAGGPQGQLYNLKSDPMETVNLYLDQPEKVSELSALLEQITQ